MGETTGPRARDGVWHHEYRNGYIQWIDWRERDVYVFFWRREYTGIPPREEVFDLDLFDCYDDRMKQWMLYGYQP